MDEDFQEPFKIRSRVQSFRHAIRGVGVMLRFQHNAWIHLLITALVGGMGVFFRVSVDEWCWLVIATGFVFAAEGFNTALENLADRASPEFHPLVRDAKDAAAGAVLIAACASAIIGLIIFTPYVYRWGFD